MLLETLHLVSALADRHDLPTSVAFPLPVANS